MRLFTKTQLFFSTKFLYMITFLATLTLIILFCVDLKSNRLANSPFYICLYKDSFGFSIKRNITFSQHVVNVTKTIFTTTTTTLTSNQNQSTVCSTISVINLMLFHVFIRFIIFL